jgi:hypothetical protein
LLHLRGLQETSDFHGAVALGGLGVANGLLAFFGVELGVVVGELLEGD